MQAIPLNEEEDARGPAFGPRHWNLYLLIAIFVIGIFFLYVVQIIFGVAAMIGFMSQHFSLASNPEFLAKLKAEDPHTLDLVFPAWSLAVAVGLAEAAMAGVCYLLAKPFFNASASNLGLTGAPTGLQLAVGIVGGIGLWVVSALVGGAQAHFFGDHPQLVEQLFQLHRDTISIICDFAGACVIAPFCEEFFFRGIVFAGLVQRMPVSLAAILSGILFGAAHADPWNFLPLAVIGVGLAYLYYRTRSLWPNIIAHFAVNTASLILIHSFPQLAK
jgi:uncharacterized protein